MHSHTTNGPPQFPSPFQQSRRLQKTEETQKLLRGWGCWPRSQSPCRVCSTESREEPSRVLPTPVLCEAPTHITTTSARTTRHGAGLFQGGGGATPRRSTCLDHGMATPTSVSTWPPSWRSAESRGRQPLPAPLNRNVLPGIRGGRAPRRHGDADASRTEWEREQAAHVREGVQEERPPEEGKSGS